MYVRAPARLWNAATWWRGLLRAYTGTGMFARMRINMHKFPGFKAPRRSAWGFLRCARCSRVVFAVFGNPTELRMRICGEVGAILPSP